MTAGPDEPGLLSTASSFSIDEKHSTLRCRDCAGSEIVDGLRLVASFNPFAAQESFETARPANDAENFNSIGDGKVKNYDFLKAVRSIDSQRPQCRMSQPGAPSHLRLGGEKAESSCAATRKLCPISAVAAEA